MSSARCATLPKQGSKRPWKLYQNYVLDLLTLRFGAVNDGTMEFRRRGRRRRDGARRAGMVDRMRLANRTAVVTGAAGGIGRAIAVSLARRRLPPGAGRHRRSGPGPHRDAGQGRTASGSAATISMSPARTPWPPSLPSCKPTHPGVDLLVNNAGVALGRHV